MNNKRKLLFIFSAFLLLTLILSGCSGTGGGGTDMYSLTVNIIGNGTVDVNGQTVADGEVVQIEEDTIVDLEVHPAFEWVFNQWIGNNGHEVAPDGNNTFKLTMDGNKEITAVFVEEATIRVQPMIVTAPPAEVDLYTTIQEAIDNAVAGDVIEVYEGTYMENITVDKNVTIRSTYPLDPEVRDETVIDGDNLDTVLKIYGECHVYGFKIINGDSLYYAGGIYINNCSPIIEYNNIIDNDGDGGGIRIKSGSDAVISNNIITENRSNDGGGIKITESSPLITNNIITANMAYQDGTGGIGGGIYAYNSSPEISENSILNNQAEANGGGIAIYYESEPVIHSNTITGNAADSDDTDHGSGGGVFVSSTCDIRDSSGVFWIKENTPPGDEPNNTYSGNTHYDGSNTDSALNGADVYWWSVD